MQFSYYHPKTKKGNYLHTFYDRNYIAEIRDSQVYNAQEEQRVDWGAYRCIQGISKSDQEINLIFQLVKKSNLNDDSVVYPDKNSFWHTYSYPIGSAPLQMIADFEGKLEKSISKFMDEYCICCGKEKKR